MTTALAELKAESLEDLEVTEEHAHFAGAVMVPNVGKRGAQVERRKWRTERRATKPLSTKIRHPGGKVDVAPVAKKGRGKS
jgi:hypothetical protein